MVGVTPPKVTIFDMRVSDREPVKSLSPYMQKTLENGEKTLNFFKEKYGRNGLDGKGSGLDIVVHTDDNGKPLNNAYWDVVRGKVYLGDGDGRVFTPFGSALDVIVHESVHAIVDSEVHLPYKGQSGGVNESFADVFASLADGNWKIAEDVFTPNVPNDSIRDLSKPVYSNTGQLPKGVDVDVHDLSGIPNFAAYKVAKTIGTDDMGKIWYKALTDHLTTNSGFSGAARATIMSAQILYGNDSRQLQAVSDAWNAVGVDPNFRSRHWASLEKSQ